MRRLAAVAVGVAALAAASSAAAADPLAVRTRVAPDWVYFADTVTARVDVIVDRSRVDPSSVRVRGDFGPWQQLQPTRVSSTGSGALGRQTWTFTLACISLACVPKGTKLQAFALPNAVVTATSKDGSPLRVTEPWPAINVAGRFEPPANTLVTPAFTVELAPPRPKYRFDPTGVALLLDVIGALLIAGSLGVATFLLVRRWRSAHVPVDTRPPLVRALALVRDAKSREPADRRRAVGLLARTLSSEPTPLSANATKVAWSEPEPSPASLEELARSVETELRGAR